MILLDTDHLTVLGFPDDSRHSALTGRMRASSERMFAITVVSVEEQMRGWLAEIKRWQDVHKRIPADDRLAKLFDFFSAWDIVPFDERAVDEFKRLRTQRIRIGTQDLKIASIALVHDALLLSANVRDFHRVPGLRVESWLE
jgi:tRNA(fMet)-specific endonuclease VapC